jgi:hypothetical protein
MTATRDWRPSLDADRMTIGKAPDDDLRPADDPAASRLHVVRDRCSAGGASPPRAHPPQLPQRPASLVVDGHAAESPLLLSQASVSDVHDLAPAPESTGAGIKRVAGLRQSSKPIVGPLLPAGHATLDDPAP